MKAKRNKGAKAYCILREVAEPYSKRGKGRIGPEKESKPRNRGEGRNQKREDTPKSETEK